MGLKIRRVPVLNCYYKTGLKFFSTKRKTEEKKYKNTIFLPKTDFPQWISPNKRTYLDEKILSQYGFKDLYLWQRENIEGPEFILHDGPPYANGVPHMGHAINKVLKDIIMRYKMLIGHKIHYKLGWDCHGLPIELKALGGDVNIKPLDIRNRARQFAKQAIEDQKVLFKKWGLMADFDKECYFTFDKDYVKNQIQQFYKLFNKGLIYRDLKPVYWSVSSNTALAEAELEYNPKHVSETVFLRLKVVNVPDILHQYSGNSPIYLLVWTTTPWTLPANEAIAYNPSFEYALVKVDGNLYIVGLKLVDHLQSKLKKPLEITFTFSGNLLKSATYEHPISNDIKNVLPATYVTDDLGTGLVHTAPSHGPDDFVLGLQHQIPIVSYVNEQGKYTQEAGKDLENLHVLGDGTKKVLTMLNDKVLLKEKLVHSYPYDWRTKKPVIIRASKQWFIDTNSVKDRAIELLNTIKVIPEKNIASFLAQLERRPYWCISRQRVWGVPIPVFYDPDENPVISKNHIDHYCKLIDENGTDFWWSLPQSDLALPDERETGNLTKGNDILDIWFDSGLSWSAVLGNKVADLYLEGVDQFTGWFQSSLLTSVALNNRAPYKTVLSHGFCVDDQGRKMSKSLGNVISPYQITHGTSIGYIKEGYVYGVDGLRWWVAAHALQHANVPVTKTTLNNSMEAMKKLRNVLKFLLGSVQDLPTDYNNPKLCMLDQYMLNRLAEFEEKIVDLYQAYELNKITQVLLNFVTNDVSSLYCHHIKDRLYCDALDSPGRRAAQYILNQILHSLLFSFSPILPVLAEEVYQYHPHNVDQLFYFHKQWRRCQKPQNEELVKSVIEKAMQVKEELAKNKPVNLNHAQLSCDIIADEDFWYYLNILQDSECSSSSELVELLQTSEVKLFKSSQGRLERR
nr:isoleucine--tRNA ligase, mitochondrial isoform X2 [Halyomorpha halys]